ncbi:hypothetical protein C9374_001616 [Naegleria lovaniensis]|uniref:Uncharacterized protein n=1 Tax=Naegleria lovaniensis TaxID=51637 RepID=A0AA88GWA2_NAELO|nr:uncharacterized protein C9374_001616 [Naegleria lovaniensis]KAG2387284.1 hypothetical protein C9374_001616 [Naegleria lovaniensis]
MVSSSTTTAGSARRKSNTGSSCDGATIKKITKKNSSSPSSPPPSITLTQPLEATLSQVLPKQRKEYTIQQKREKWSDDEHEKFLEAIRIHGRDWKKVEDFIGTKTRKQIRSHAQKHFEKMKKNGEEFPKPRAKRKSLKPYPSKKTNEIYNALSNDQIVSNLKKIPNEFFEKLISHHDVSETIRLIHLLVTASANNDEKDRSAAVKNFSEKERNLIRTVIHNATNLLSSEKQESSTTSSSSMANNHHLLFLTSLFTNFSDLLSNSGGCSMSTSTMDPSVVGNSDAFSPASLSSSNLSSPYSSSQEVVAESQQEILNYEMTTNGCNNNHSTTTSTSTVVLPAHPFHTAFEQGMFVVIPSPPQHHEAHDDYVVFSNTAAGYCVSPSTCTSGLSESDSSADEFSPSLSADDADDEKMTQLISDFTNHDDADGVFIPNHQASTQQFCTILPSPFASSAASNFYCSTTTPALYIPPALHLPHSDQQQQHFHLNPIQMNLLQNSLLMMNVVVGGGANFENLLVENTSSPCMDDIDDGANVNSIFESF